MSKKIRQISMQGHRVLGALAAYLAPKMAADKALKAGDLDSVIKSIKPAAFDKQINGIVGTVKEKFSPRLAKDAELDPEELKELMQAIEPFEDLDVEEGEDEDDMEGGELEDADGPGEKLMAMLQECGIPEEKLNSMNELITQLGKGVKAEDEFPAKPKKDDKKKEEEPVKDKKGKDEFPSKTEEKPQAMDAAAVKKSVQASIAAQFKAAEEVKPYIGVVDPLAFDSAEKIYEYALKNNGISTKNIHPSAYSALLPLIAHKDDTKTAVAMDAASQAELAKEFTYIPAKA